MGFLQPDTSFYSEYTDKGKYLLTWRLSVLFAFVFAMLSLSLIFIHLIAFFIYFSAFLIAFLGIIYLHKTKKYEHIYWSYSIGGSTLISISFYTEMNTVHYAEFFWIISIILFSYIGLSRKVGLFFLAFNGVSVLLHLTFFLNDTKPIERPATFVESVGILVEIVLGLFMVAYLLNQYLKFQSYAERQLIRVNKELAEQNNIIVKKNAENAVLVKEIHHRVKNNLQIIVSLLRMHSEEVSSEETKTHFAEAMNRIMSMSLIHDKLYQEKELSSIDFDSYLNELIQEIMRSFVKNNQIISCDFKSDLHLGGLKTLVPLGLLINELMTNSIKHAFNEQETGTITIRIQEKDQQIILEYSDSGTWKAAEEQQTGFGVELVGLLTHQLDGTLERSGSTYHFTLTNLDT